MSDGFDAHGRTIDVFRSFRSPCRDLALDRLLDLDRRFDVDVVVRPVSPLAVRKPEFFRNVLTGC